MAVAFLAFRGPVTSRSLRIGSNKESKSRSAASSSSESRCPAFGLAPWRHRCTVRTLTRSNRASARHERSAAAQNSANRFAKSGGNRAGSVRYTCSCRRPTGLAPPAPLDEQVLVQKFPQPLRHLRRQPHQRQHRLAVRRRALAPAV